MADMYTPEEINEIFAAYNDAVQKNIPISKDLAQQMKDATLGVKNYTQQLQSSLKKLGTSFTSFGADMAKGEKGAAVFNGVLSSGADAVSDYAAKFGPAGRAIGALTKAASSYVGAVNKQADALFKSYKDISRAGVVGAGGMQEVYANMQRFGYGIEELGEFTGLMKSNSEVLAKFGGTAFNGASQFATLADEIQHSDIGKRLMNMGVSVDEINQGTAGFLKQQTMMGRNAASMQRTLTVETTKYLENLEAVARLTGQSREQLQQKQQDAMNEQQFAAAQYELKQKALAGDEEAATQLRKLQFLNENLSGEQRLNVIRAFAGDVAASGNLLTAMPGVFQMMTDATKDEADVMFEITKASKRNLSDQIGLFKLGAGEDTFGKVKEQIEILAQFGKAANPEEIREMMEATRKNSETTNDATKRQVETERAQRNARDNLQDFVNLGINPVTYAMMGLAKAVEFLTSFLPGSGKGKGTTKQKNSAATSAYNQSGEFAGMTDAIGGDMAAGGSGGTVSTDGLNIKSAESISGGSHSDALLALAHDIQNELGSDLKYFSGLNDSRANDGKSKHGSGQALDIVLKDPKKYASVLSTIKSMSGVSLAQFERAGQTNANGSVSSGAHIHAEVSAANGFNGIMSGPTSGYKPNLTMHGTEQISIQPNPNTGSTSPNSESRIMQSQLDKLDELVSVMKSQLSVSNKLLSYSS